MTTKQAQHLLSYLGYDPGTCDGITGENTQAAVKAFQADYGLCPDGIAGAQTTKMLIGAVAGTAAKVNKKYTETGGNQPPVEAAQYLQADGCYHIPRGVDVQLTRNFRAKEIHCQGVGCCTESVISKRIMDLAQAIRDDLGEPLTIAASGGSGYRCKVHNASTPGASPNSLHTISDAVDLHYRDPAKLKAVVMKHLKDGEVGLYPWGCHVGRWDRGYVSQFYK